MKKPDFLAVETEIQQEKAETLGRAGERLERALQELETFRRHIMDLAGSPPASALTNSERVPAGMGEKLAQYARLREEAKQLRHCLIIQREAVRLWRHDDVDRLYPVPPPLTLPAVTHPDEDGR
jgi:hypothetical protein